MQLSPQFVSSPRNQQLLADSEQKEVVTLPTINVRRSRGEILNFHWGRGNELVLFNTISKKQALVNCLHKEQTQLTDLHQNLLKADPRKKEEVKNNIEDSLQRISQCFALLKSPFSGEYIDLSQLVLITGQLFNLYNKKSAIDNITAHISKNIETIIQRLRETTRGVTTDKHSERSVHIFRWNIFFPLSRKLISESESYFTSLQRIVSGVLDIEDAEERLAEKREKILEVCKYYKAILTAHSIDFTTAPAAAMDLKWHSLHGSLQEEFENEMQMFQIATLVFHLAQVFFVDPSPFILPQLIEWCFLYFAGDCVAECAEVIKLDAPDTHPQYWPLVYKFLLHGQIRTVRELLKHHSHNLRMHRDVPRDNDIFSIIDVLLKSMPQWDAVAGNEYFPNFTQWRQSCINVRDTRRDVSSSPELLTLFNILCGEEDTLIEYTDTWHALLIAKLIFSDPTVEKDNIRYVARQCIEAYTAPTPLDNIILSIIECDAVQTLHLCSSSFDNLWLTAHLADILYHSESIDAPFGIKLREYFLQEYAIGLLSNRGLWQIIPSYLVHSSYYSKLKHIQGVPDNLFDSEHLLRNVLEFEPFDTEFKAQKILNLSLKYKLDQQYRSVHAVVAMKKFKHRKYAATIRWFAAADATQRLIHVINRALQQYLEDGTIEDIEAVIEHLGSDFRFSNSLFFMNKLHQLHELQQNGDESKRVQLIVELLTEDISPPHIKPLLLLQLAAILQKPSARLSSEKTFLLLECLEELSLSHKRSSLFTSVDAKQLESIQVALVRQLSTAVTGAELPLRRPLKMQ